MATLKKHGNVIADYTRHVWQKHFNYALGYIFRLMSDDTLLVRSAYPGKKWRIFRKTSNIEEFRSLSKKSDNELRKLLDDCFN